MCLSHPDALLQDSGLSSDGEMVLVCGGESSNLLPGTSNNFLPCPFSLICRMGVLD